MEMFFICCCTWIMAIVFSNAKGTAILTLPTSVNCGDQAVLTCTSTECNVGFRFRRDSVTIYNHGGPQTGADPARYSATVTSPSQVLLTISNMQLSDAGTYQCSCGFDASSAQQTLRYECKATLSLPESANCGDQADLMCTSTDCNVDGYRFIRDGFTVYNHRGPQTGADPARYSATVTSPSQVLLTITNIQLPDAGAYQCSCGFDGYSATQTLRYECKAVSSTAAITANKKLRMTMDRLYPQPSSIVTSLINTTSQLPGTYTCGISPTVVSHYTCTWNSAASLPDGNHSYIITVTISTEASPLFGSFMIVTPPSPTVSNLSTISNNRQVVRGAQDTPLTIQCVSKGGIPAPTLAWYRVNTSTSPLTQLTTSDSVQQSDGTYKVTIIHTFTPSRRDDMTPFLCRVFYPGATTGASPDPSPASAVLYLDLKPDKPTVSQTGEAASEGSMKLRCTSTNGRPAPSIMWDYRDQTFTPAYTSIFDQTSETYTVVSVLQRPVSYVDNGQTATCRVFHTSLTVPLNSTINVDVKYECNPSSSMGSTVAVSVSTTAFITIVLGIVVIVIVIRQYPNFVMRLVQHTCESGNISQGTEIDTGLQSQSLKRSEKQVVYSTLVAAEDSKGENLETTPTYESLNPSGSQPVYTSLEAAAEQRNTYENLNGQ